MKIEILGNGLMAPINKGQDKLMDPIGGPEKAPLSPASLRRRSQQSAAGVGPDEPPVGGHRISPDSSRAESQLADVVKVLGERPIRIRTTLQLLIPNEGEKVGSQYLSWAGQIWKIDLQTEKEALAFAGCINRVFELLSTQNVVQVEQGLGVLVESVRTMTAAAGDSSAVDE